MASVALTETFLDVKEEIHRTVRWFNRNYKGDREEQLSEAYLAFMKAYESYDPDKGAFKDWIRYKVRCGLFEAMRTDIGRMNRRPPHKSIGDSINDVQLDPASRPEVCPFDLQAFKANLSMDGRRVARYAVKPPPVVNFYALERGGYLGHHYRGAIKTYLKELGWKLPRITSAFAEVRSAL